VHYWVDLQSVHRFRCYDNIAPNVCLSVSLCIPTLLHGPGCYLGMVGVLPSCAVLGRFAIDVPVQVLLL